MMVNTWSVIIRLGSFISKLGLKRCAVNYAMTIGMSYFSKSGHLAVLLQGGHGFLCHILEF